jgi:hypothetical protein
MAPPPVARSCLRAPSDPHASTNSHDEDWKPEHLAAMQVCMRFYACYATLFKIKLRVSLVNVAWIWYKFGMSSEGSGPRCRP